MRGLPLLRGEFVSAPAFGGSYDRGIVEGFCLRPDASRKLRRARPTGSLVSDVWVLYREQAGHARLLVLHETWVAGLHPLERLARAAVDDIH